MIESILIILASTGLVTCQNAQYTAYRGYSASDFENVVGSFVPTVDDCLAQSTAQPLSNGAAYQSSTKQCVLMTNDNNMLAIKLRVNAGWDTYVKDKSATFVPVFVSYSAQTNNTFPIVQVFTTGTGGLVTTNYSYALSNRSSGNYWNSFIANWNANQVMYQMSVAGFTVAQYVFNGKSTNSTNWLSQANLLASVPYNLLRMRTLSLAKFDLAGGSSNGLGQVIYTASSCAAQTLFTVYASQTSCTAAYGLEAAGLMYPGMVYSQTRNEQQVNTVGSALADRLTISVKTSNRIVFV